MNEKVGILGAIGTAIVASICCIGPVVLAGLGIGAVAAAQAFAPYRPLFLAVTAVLLGLGFYYAYRKPKQAACEGEVCETPRVTRWGRPLLWIATAIVVALVTFPYYYGSLYAAFDKSHQPAPVADKPAQLSTVELKISGMTCGGCVISVRKALLETPGVTAAEVDLDSARAKVVYDQSKVAKAELIEAISKTGFKASL
ncbi:MAG: mercuric transporter MerT family protein [Acidobacteria bacterium]|nr:mercuric transporter MerT family protein [Acidobacteriota bacterium]